MARPVAVRRPHLLPASLLRRGQPAAIRKPRDSGIVHCGPGHEGQPSEMASNPVAE
jgi:hypothetical protein